MDAVSLLNKLIEKKDLTEEEAEFFLEGVISGNISGEQTAAILVALRMKGETVSEIIGLIKVMRKHMIKVKSNSSIDVCGTGGDGSGSFNISTTCSFVVVGGGVSVVKHGNRAASSKCGSADVLEELGVNINLSAKDAEKIVKKIGMVFLFAPLFHPATKNVVAVRKDLKIRTVFNFLGPFLNPASVSRQLIGVPSIEIAEKLIQVGKKLGYKHLLIISSEDGMDEVSIAAQTKVYELKSKKISKFVIDPKEFGFKKHPKKAIGEGSLAENAKYLKDVLSGVKNAKRDIVVLNSAVAFYTAEKVSDIKKGIELAEESIDSGAAKKVLENFIKESRRYA